MGCRPRRRAHHRAAVMGHDNECTSHNGSLLNSADAKNDIERSRLYEIVDAVVEDARVRETRKVIPRTGKGSFVDVHQYARGRAVTQWPKAVAPDPAACVEEAHAFPVLPG